MPGSTGRRSQVAGVRHLGAEKGSYRLTVGIGLVSSGNQGNSAVLSLPPRPPLPEPPSGTGILPSDAGN